MERITTDKLFKPKTQSELKTFIVNVNEKYNTDLEIVGGWETDFNKENHKDLDLKTVMSITEVAEACRYIVRNMGIYVDLFPIPTDRNMHYVFEYKFVIPINGEDECYWTNGEEYWHHMKVLEILAQQDKDQRKP